MREAGALLGAVLIGLAAGTALSVGLLLWLAEQDRRRRHALMDAEYEELCGGERL